MIRGLPRFGLIDPVHADGSDKSCGFGSSVRSVFNIRRLHRLRRFRLRSIHASELNTSFLLARSGAFSNGMAAQNYFISDTILRQMAGTSAEGLPETIHNEELQLSFQLNDLLKYGG